MDNTQGIQIERVALCLQLNIRRNHSADYFSKISKKY